MNNIQEQIEQLRNLGWYATQETEAADVADTMQKMLAVVQAVVKLGKDCRYDADDWVLSPELAQEYVEPVYQQALAALDNEDE